jgi:hypothetical protein
MTLTGYAAVGAAILVLIWYAIVLAYSLSTRSWTLSAAAPTPDLGDEPPAVVNLLVNRGQLTADAADATLLDLAARWILDLHQPGDDPAQLLVRVRVDDPVGLLTYERRVFDRVAALAGARWVSLAQVTAGYAEGGPNWFAQLRKEVLADAQERGLIRLRRLGSPIILLCLLTGMALACLGILPLQRDDQSAAAQTIGFATVLGWFCAGPLVALALIFVSALHLRGARLTPVGRSVGGHWLGVAGWLAAHDALADLPPAAVAVWNRYLAYGVALGTNPVASAALDLRVGRTGWFTSHYTGVVRTIRVRYPRDPFAYTQAGVRLTWSLSVLAAWGVAGWLLWSRVAHASVPVRWSLYGLGLAVGGRQAYKLIRSLIAKLFPASVTGQVLTVHAYRPTADHAPRWYQLALDDGRHDNTRPWLVRQDRLRDITPGDVISIGAQRWTRYVRTLDVVRRRPTPVVAKAVTEPG